MKKAWIIAESLWKLFHKYRKRSPFLRWLKTLAAGSNSSEQNPSYRNAVIESCTESHKARSSGKNEELDFILSRYTTHTDFTLILLLIVHSCTIVSFVIYFSSWAGLNSNIKISEKRGPCPGCPFSFLGNSDEPPEPEKRRKDGLQSENECVTSMSELQTLTLWHTSMASIYFFAFK